MSKKIITVTNKGVRESVVGSGLPSSSELRMEAAMVSPPLTIAANSTGTVGSESLVIALGPCVVVLPPNPTSGQKVAIAVIATGVNEPIGVSASNGAFLLGNNGPLGGINVAPASSESCLREFFYIEVGPNKAWMGGDNGGAGGVTGSYTF